MSQPRPAPAPPHLQQEDAVSGALPVLVAGEGGAQVGQELAGRLAGVTGQHGGNTRPGKDDILVRPGIILINFPNL